MLAHRTCFDIKKQLSSITNLEHRQEILKSLLRKQKETNTASLRQYDFNKELHYKSPLEQSDVIELCSMYTV